MSGEQIVTVQSNNQMGRKRKSLFAKGIYILFYIFALYLVIPLIDIPLLGLSLSAPIFFFIALACILRPPRPWFRRYESWILLAALIWLGILISTAANGLLSFGVNIDTQGYEFLLRYLYWIVVFIITAYFANQDKVMGKIVPILGIGVLIVALLRWAEVIFAGRLGAASFTTIMTQNTYGFQFSTFSPFVLIMFLKEKKGKKIFWLISLIIMLGAVAVNGSRGSWVSIGIGFAFTALILFFAKPRKLLGGFFVIAFTVVAGILLWTYVPQAAKVIETRFDTFQNLGEDRNYAIRQVMIQKGLRLFQETPIIGVGANRFTLTWTDISLPDLLSYRSVAEFETKNAHNSYIQFLAEFGLIGSIPFAILLLILVFRGFSTVNKEVHHNQLIPLAIFISFIQMSIHMWVITALTGTMVWFIYGLLVAVIKFHSPSRRVSKGKGYLPSSGK